MSKAAYSTENIGHYGLAFDYYSHFTSPIRRYPDVMAHRLLQFYIDGGKSVSEDEYEENTDIDNENLINNKIKPNYSQIQLKILANHFSNY